MRSLLPILALMLTLALCCQAGVIGFVSSPTTDSSDFATAVVSNGGSLNTSINFDTHPTGALQADFYSGLGATLGGTGDFTSVQNGAGPGQGNTSAPPLSGGEGLHAISNFVGGNIPGGTFTVSFSSAVLGVGLFTVDLFNPGGVFNNATIEIFDGPDGTGTSLGTFNAVGYNFQPNNLYFMGAISTSNDIRSLVFTSTGGGGDVIGLDNVEFATTGIPTGVPEPGALGLLGLGLATLAAGRLFRSRS
jgi:hypothetical protein